jgi:hypothetical protein
MRAHSSFGKMHGFRIGGAAAVVAKLRDLAPYAVIELVLPGGSLMALLLWLYRRRKRFPSLAIH